jgi:hypothetical protein
MAHFVPAQQGGSSGQVERRAVRRKMAAEPFLRERAEDVAVGRDQARFGCMRLGQAVCPAGAQFGGGGGGEPVGDGKEM